MRTFTITAILGALVAIPLVFGNRKGTSVPVPVKTKNNGWEVETNLRYDVDDFLTE